MYRSLSSQLIEATVVELHVGLAHHFPNSGLSKVAGEVVDVARQLEQRVVWIRPGLTLALRASVAGVVLGIVGALLWLIPVITSLGGVRSLAEFMEAAESGFQLVLLLGAAVFFFITVERRIVRQSALAAVAELRSLVHVVDMHQLRKGPEHLRTAAVDAVTLVSAVEGRELIRYLDYCSELLAMLSKMCAYYVQRVQDPDVLAAVQEVQVVAIGLSQKIWQKVAILDRLASSPEPKPGDRDGDYGVGVASP